MKKILFRTAAYAVCAAIFAYLFIHISYAVRPKLSHTQDNISGFYGEEKNSLDVVFVGSSGTMSAFMPLSAYKEHGFTSYNFCFNELCYQTMPYAVKEVLKYQKPKVLFIDIKTFIRPVSILTAFANGEEGTCHFNTDAFKYSLDRAEFIWRYLPHTSAAIPYYLDLVKYHREPFNYKNWNSEIHFTNRGFQFMSWGNEIDFPAPTDKELPVEASIEAAYRETMEVAKTASPDTEVVFLYYPYANTIYNDTPLENLNYLVRITEEAGLPFLNLSPHYDEFGFDVNVDYWNNGHWNVYGAEKVTAYMGKYLTEHYDLPDHRGDEAYSLWDADAKKWRKRIRKEKKIIDKARSKA
ncbi:MAG: SGNH/GDSL hydrolase family protein [Lachnospiraceae bacterium]|nr:SGNH/GDSL hydrolase family protein [Lachnospiraceae bacterium]